MKVSRTRAALLVLAAVAMVGLSACGDDDGDDTTGGDGGTETENGGSESSAEDIEISSADFTADFSAMEVLQPIVEAGEGKVAVLLPDTESSARYEAFDRPYLQQAFEAAGMAPDDIIIQNAQGSASTMQTQAEAAITDGAVVLLVDALDSGSGAAIESAATAQGVRVIDYDRLVQGGAEDRVYVSFDNVSVGQLIGEGFTQCVADWGVEDPQVLIMNGDPTDNNATLFAEGYHRVVDPLFDDGTMTLVGEPAGTWTPSEAQTTFDQQFTANPQINAVITPNDDNANAVIASLQQQGVEPETFPTTGQDASLSGLQNILKGYQCGTVYKPIYLEAQAAAAAAIYLRAGMEIPDSLLNGTTADPEAGTDVPSILVVPIWVTAENMADTVVADGAVEVDELCVTEVADACEAARIG